MQTESSAAVEQIVEAYFKGLHFADTTLLRSIFSDDCVLKSPGIRRSLNDWLSFVGSRPVPADINAPFAYQILDIQMLGEQAMVKAYCPLLGNHFIDYLGLLHEHGRWRIVNKMYADQPDGDTCEDHKN